MAKVIWKQAASPAVVAESLTAAAHAYSFNRICQVAPMCTPT